MVHISQYVQSVAGGERAKHMPAKRPEGMIRLDSGTPSFPTPEHICQAAKDALDEGLTFYAPGYGDPEFLAGACEAIRRESGGEYLPEDVFATNGASSGIYTVMTAFLDPGDEVIIMDPTFSLYSHVARQLGTVPVLVPHDAAYHLDLGAIRAAITDKTRLILFCNPNNPTGVVYTRDEVQALVGLCAEKDLLLVSDEAYDQILQPGYEHVPILSFTEHKDRTILLKSLSKTYSMTGWRVGWMIGPADLVRAAGNLQSHATSNVSNVSQRAALAAVAGDLTDVMAMREAFDRRRVAMSGLLRQIDGLELLEPQGAFYAYPDMSALLGREIVGRTAATTNELAGIILEEAKVAIVPGEAFGTPGYARLSFALGDDDLREGLTRMVDLLNG